MNMGAINLLTLFAFCGWGLFSCGDRVSNKTTEESFSIQIDSKEAVAKANIRGLFLVNDKVGWASGSGGTFLRMTDGENWLTDSIAGYTHLDFRDVHGFDENTALLMAAGEEGRIIRTEDGGVSWTEVYTRLDSGIFLDGMDFYENVGYCYGDPIDGKFVVVRSKDSGKTWTEFSRDQLPNALPNEAGFAASGTGIVVNEYGFWFGTGGSDSSSRIIGFPYKRFEWSYSNTSMRTGEGCGIFSLVYFPPKNVMMVGGSYKDSTNRDGNFGWFLLSISPNTDDPFITAEIFSDSPPRGYRSCVAGSSLAKLLVACGRTGVEYSEDGGLSWIPLSDDGYYTCALADSTGWLMGRGGKMAKLSW